MVRACSDEVACVAGPRGSPQCGHRPQSTADGHSVGGDCTLAQYVGFIMAATIPKEIIAVGTDETVTSLHVISLGQ